MRQLLVLLIYAFMSLRVAAAPVTAQMADSVVESAGICTHLSYTDKPYYTQWPTVRQRLLDLGVRHIRDGEASADFVSKIKDLAINGVRTIWVMDPGAGITPTQEFWTPSSRTRQLLVPFLKNNALTNTISSIEIMNEIDLFYNRTWIADYTQAGYFWKANNVNSTNHLVDVSTSPLWWGNYIVAMASNTWSVVKSDPATPLLQSSAPASAPGTTPRPPAPTLCGTLSISDAFIPTLSAAIHIAFMMSTRPSIGTSAMVSNRAATSTNGRSLSINTRGLMEQNRWRQPRPAGSLARPMTL